MKSEPVVHPASRPWRSRTFPDAAVSESPMARRSNLAPHPPRRLRLRAVACSSVWASSARYRSPRPAKPTAFAPAALLSSGRCRKPRSPDAPPYDAAHRHRHSDRASARPARGVTAPNRSHEHPTLYPVATAVAHRLAPPQAWKDAGRQCATTPSKAVAQAVCVATGH